MAGGPTHRAMPGSTKSVLIQDDSQPRWQSQYSGFPPSALQRQRHESLAPFTAFVRVVSHMRERDEIIERAVGNAGDIVSVQ